MIRSAAGVYIAPYEGAWKEERRGDGGGWFEHKGTGNSAAAATAAAATVPELRTSVEQQCSR